MLRENVSDPAIEKDIDRAWRDYPKGFVAFLQDGEVPSNSSDEWHSTSCQRAFRKFDIMDCTAMFVTKR